MSEDRLDWPTITIDRDAKTGEHLYILKPDEYDRFKAEVKRLQGTLNEAIDQSGRLGHELNVQDATIATLREKYKVHENKYAVPLMWKSDSHPGREYEGFVVGVDEGTGIRTLVQENATLREAVRILTAGAKGEHHPFTHDHEHDESHCPICRMIKEYEALAPAQQEEEDGPLFEGKWTGVMGPVEEEK